MIVIPAIDLKDGKVVRFTQGKFNKKVYSHDPVKTAKYWQKQGAKLIHVVDLDGAFGGRPKNLAVLKRILEAVNVPIEFGGGIRNKNIIKKLISLGVARLVIGTLAIENKRFFPSLDRKIKDKLIISIDEARGKVLSRGWRKEAGALKTLELAKKIRTAGFRKIIFTDTTRDGTLTGPNIRRLEQLLKNTGLKIIASGGISSLDDIKKLRRLESRGLEGIIIGKALYEGKFTLVQALNVAKP